VDEFPHKDKRCYVLSRKVQHQKDDNVMFYQGGITKLVDELKSSTKKYLHRRGTEVIYALRKESLIDEYILFIAPILLGSGTSLFKEIQAEERLILLGSQPYLSGYVRLHYQTKNNDIALTQSDLPKSS
jgi:dihydrofolate reductase